MIRSLRSRIMLAIGVTMLVAAAATLGFVALELAELRRGEDIDPAHVEYAELLIVLLPFALLTPIAGAAVAAWSLRPLTKAAAEARAIGPEGPERRIDTIGLPHEARPLVEAVNAALDRLAQALMNERRLAADAAHALRTPLAIAKLRLARGTLAAEDVQKLAADLDRIDRSLEQLLSLARLDARAGTSAEPIDAARLARTIAAEFLPIADAQHRALEVYAPHPVCVRAANLDEALRNLIHNALRHGCGTVRVAARAIEGEASVSVSDEGGGVPAAGRLAMLARFGRGSGSSGSGLGLSIVARIAARAGGALHWPDNARLELRLPIVRFATTGSPGPDLPSWGVER